MTIIILSLNNAGMLNKQLQGPVSFEMVDFLPFGLRFIVIITFVCFRTYTMDVDPLLVCDNDLEARSEDSQEVYLTPPPEDEDSMLTDRKQQL